MLFGAVDNVKISIPDSLLVLLIGMVVIFLVLAILIGVVHAYVSACKGLDKLKGKNKKSEKQAVSSVNVTSGNTDEEIVAAIMAAITAVYESESEDGEVPPFRVKSIVKK